MRKPRCVRKLVIEEHGYALVESIVFATLAIVAITSLALPIFVQERKLLALNQLAFAISRASRIELQSIDVQLLADKLKQQTVLAYDVVIANLSCQPADCSTSLARRVFTLVDKNLVAKSFAIND